MKAPESINLKKQLRYYLRVKNLSAAELARRSGVNKQSISNWLGGIEPKSFIHVKKIADALNLTIDELIFGDSSCVRKVRSWLDEHSIESGDQHTSEIPTVKRPSLIDSLEAGCVVSFNGFMRDVSPQFCRLLGWSEKELFSRPFLEFIHPSDRRRANIKLLRHNLGPELSHTFPMRLICKSGDSLWLRFRTIVSPSDRLSISLCEDLTSTYPPEVDTESYFSLNHLVREALDLEASGLSASLRACFDSSFSSEIFVKCRPIQLKTAISSLTYHLIRNQSPQIALGIIPNASSVKLIMRASNLTLSSSLDSEPGYSVDVVQHWIQVNAGQFQLKKTLAYNEAEIDLPIGIAIKDLRR